MLKFLATDLVISKGYGDHPALRFSEGGTSVRFRVGKRVYDKQAPDNYRWVNLNIKAFGGECERIKKMKLDAGSFIHLEGRYDEDVWEEDSTTKRVPVIILTDVEYSYTGNGSKQNGNSKDAADAQNTAQAQKQENSQAEMPGNFTGFTSFDGPNPFYPPQNQ